MELPKSGIEQFVLELAQANDVAYESIYKDNLFEKFTELSCDDVEQDGVEKLIIALKKADVIDAEQMIYLLHGYLKEVYSENGQ